ncbi:MAG TPA: MFS transporter [Nitriliruptoraceae bacterium]|nr:MFS transporter [Nitriliruptoraceae bacterium]
MSSSPANDPVRPSTFAPLAVPEYRRIWLAFLVSNLGTFLQMTAAPWLMLELTGSVFMVALVTASMTLPRLLLTLPAGALADQFDRRIMASIGQVIASLAVAVMAVTTWQDELTPVLLLALTFGVGMGTAISLPAIQTLVPDLVDEDLVSAAVSLNSASFNVARAVGPAIGGAFVAAGAADVAFGLNALSYLAVIGVLVSLPTLGSADRSSGGVWQSTRIGLRFVRFTRAVMLVVVVTAVFNLTATSFQTLLPNVVSDDLSMGPEGFGFLLGVFGAGSLMGALSRERVRTRVRLILPVAIALNGVTGIVFGFVSRTPVASAALLFVAGLTWVWTVTTMNTIVQVVAPRWVRGRAMSVYLLAALGMQPIAAIVAGSLAEVVGAANAVGVLSIATVALGLVAHRINMPVLGEIRPPMSPDDFSVPRHASQLPGSPLIVATRWKVDLDTLPEWFDAMRTLRRHRLRTGALAWSLFRHAEDPATFTEYVRLQDWEAHLAQHAHLDADAAAAIAHARSFDVGGGPTTQHVSRIDLSSEHLLDDQEVARVAHDRLHEQLHADLHASDGSIPLRPWDDADGQHR